MSYFEPRFLCGSSPPALRSCRLHFCLFFVLKQLDFSQTQSVCEQRFLSVATDARSASGLDFDRPNTSTLIQVPLELLLYVEASQSQVLELWSRLSRAPSPKFAVSLHDSWQTADETFYVFLSTRASSCHSSISPHRSVLSMTSSCPVDRLSL